MATKIVVFVLCTCSVNATYTSDFYTAAVFEHVRHDDPRDRPSSIARNMDESEHAAHDAAAQGADIIVLPEIGIMPTSQMTVQSMKEIYEELPYPDPSSPWTPCLTDSAGNTPVLTRLSCMAKNTAIYIVANIGEKEPCSPQEDPRCPEEIETLFYNTNVVFDSNGTLVAKHRKRFPFFEAHISRPTRPEYTTFNTSFGSFGVIICFDSVFKEAVEVVENFHVENMLISTWWFDELPSMTANNFFQSWALANKVNVIVANIHKPISGSIGSMIASGTHGALNYTFKPTRTTSELLIARVPRSSKYDIPSIIEFETNAVDDTLDGYHHMNANLTSCTMKPLEHSSGSLEACNNGLCCQLNYSAKSVPRKFFLVVFSGIRSISDYYFIGSEFCALVQCASAENCNTFPETSETVFESVVLAGNLTTRYQYPYVTASELRLVPRAFWDHSLGRISFQSGDVDVQLLSMGINGRCYERDPPFPESNTFPDDAALLWTL